MTKKDFELIANAMRQSRMHWIKGVAADFDSFRQGIDGAASELAHALAATNPRFDRARFLEACGVAS